VRTSTVGQQISLGGSGLGTSSQESIGRGDCHDEGKWVVLKEATGDAASILRQ
jgi:hypothetical protein